jgi:hypothetical protein
VLRRNLLPFAFCFGLLLFPAPSNAQDTVPRAFVHRLILTDTPDMGLRWRGGFQTTDILMWDFFLNVNDWFTFGTTAGGLSIAPKDSATHLQDLVWVLSFKSRPMLSKVTKDRYGAAAGVKIYYSRFMVMDPRSPQDSISSKDAALMLFLTQRVRLGDRNFINLFTSLSLDNYGYGRLRMNHDSAGRRATSIIAVPGYRFHIGRGWNLELEYILTNAMYLPLATLQIISSSAPLPIENIGQEWLSLMAWGIQYRGRHFDFGCHILNHYTFQGLILPMVSLGWNF